MRRWFACFCLVAITATWTSAPARAQFYQARPQPVPTPPSLNYIGVPGQELPQIRVEQFGPTPVRAAPAPNNHVSGRSPTIGPPVVRSPYWFVPWRLRRR